MTHRTVCTGQWGEGDSGPGVAPDYARIYVPGMRRSMAWRVFAVFWAVLQFALPGVAMLADARIERDSRAAPGAHVESGTSQACRPVHPEECTLCQVLVRVAPPSESPALPAIADAVRPSATSPILRHATRALAAVALPRAPPSLS